MKGVVLCGSDVSSLENAFKSKLKDIQNSSGINILEYPAIESFYDLEKLSQKDIFGSKKIIIIHNLSKEFHKKMLEILPALEDVFIFVFNQEKNPFEKEKTLFESFVYNTPKPYEIEKILKKTLPQYTSTQVIAYLSYFIKSLNEIDEIAKKIDFYKISDLSFENINLLFPNGYEVQTFLIDEFLFSGDKAKKNLFFGYIRSLEKEDSDFLERLLTSIRSRLVDLIKIKTHLEEGLTPEAIVSAVGGHPFFVNKLISYARGFSLENLNRNLASAHQSLFDMRKHRIFKGYYLEKFIFFF